MVSHFFAASRSSCISFFLPSITSYRGLKPFSTSTARSFFGRSLTWPSEAITTNCLPRYLLIVFAFAGDSTITKAFAISNLCSKNKLRSAFTRAVTTRIKQPSNPAHYHTLTKFRPGSCFAKPRISSSNNAAMISDGEASSTVSTRVSRWQDWSGFKWFRTRRAT